MPDADPLTVFEALRTGFAESPLNRCTANIAERSDLRGAGPSERHPHHRHRDADIHEVEDTPGAEDRGDLLIHRQRELGGDHVVLENRVTQPVLAHVLVAEVEPEIGEGGAVERAERKPAHTGADEEPALAEGLGALGENRSGRVRRLDRKSVHDLEGGTTAGGRDREVGGGWVTAGMEGFWWTASGPLRTRHSGWPQSP
jgi:hypothetical protein